ncbi:MAG: hypothetical protein ABJF10_23255 [Chthoniobacter sp.]|uniref:hypothetical protein n=1 Tax=Chthoniobacter sp. TaxID=2510640 RepID=UPI0032AB5FDB
MNYRCILPILLAALPASAWAADWEALSHTPALIEVVGMQSSPLVESTDKKSWVKVPPAFLKYGAVIYMPPDKGNGVADIKVNSDGYLLLACNYDNQGNKGGNWAEEVWDEKTFKIKGWHALSAHELDGELVKGDNRAQVVFTKQVHKGETLRLRCNKYDPPYPILLLGVKPQAAKP